MTLWQVLAYATQIALILGGLALAAVLVALLVELRALAKAKTYAILRREELNDETRSVPSRRRP